ncbi:site-2 protease family protein [Carboxydochorda subterranea]|uniref:Site-2 protease family protein n=1 Tax=Carboxydichorda subterranea TaxID=3109565 RepID=A0ABZ1BZU3_9FIRM|nr:site-2 protease family protein [Limnochorda sp. L945t]WRP18224.1 site-2 protease family protein [Limnochorda sp. L945t]
MHPAFLLLALLLVLAGAGVRAAMLFGAVLAHEMAHVVWARRRGVRAHEVQLHPFGGVARLDEAALVEPADEIPIIFAGPAASLMAGLALVAAGRALGAAHDSVPSDGGPAGFAVAMLTQWGWDHLGLGAFNLLPAFPLDGGRLLRALLARRMGFRPATRQVSLAGEIAGAVMAIVAAWQFAVRGEGLWSAVMGLFLLHAARGERQRASGSWAYYLARQAGSRRAVSGVMEGRILVAPGAATVMQVADRLVPDRYHLVVVADPSGRLVGLTDEGEVLRVLVGRGASTPVASLPARRL